MSRKPPLQTKQIAERLGCSTKTVSRCYHAGKLPGAIKMGVRSPIRISEAGLRKIKNRGSK